MAIIHTYFTPTGKARMSAGATSSNVQLPQTGSPGIMRVTNLGPNPAFVVLGSDNTVVATVATGVTILPNSSEYLIASTWLAAITTGGNAALNIDMGN